MPNQEELDALIRQLIQQIVESTDESPQLREAMDRLLSLIPNLTGIYGRTYPEAMNRALEGISMYQGNISGNKLRRFQQKFRQRFSVDINNAAPIVVRKNDDGAARGWEHGELVAKFGGAVERLT